jgi:hypothetical protein
LSLSMPLFSCRPAILQIMLHRVALCCIPLHTGEAGPGIRAAFRGGAVPFDIHERPRHFANRVALCCMVLHRVASRLHTGEARPFSTSTMKVACAFRRGLFSAGCSASGVCDRLLERHRHRIGKRAGH